MNRTFKLKAAATVILFVRNYWWHCSFCKHKNIVDRATEDEVICELCKAIYGIALVFHTHARKPLFPGTKQVCLKKGLRKKHNPQVEGETITPAYFVDLFATGYKWFCCECDPFVEKPKGLVSPLALTVACKTCGANFPVSEARHRILDIELNRDLIGHNLRIIIQEPLDDENEKVSKTLVTFLGDK